ncbi:hypothetical protein ACFZCV_27855 [Streptomyces sp. NPDC007920]|uniref:hypothetical protein n=1 Tax=Streptomyces sp. NPDC007920 TaxID=3364794 RepID=UPI0036EA6F05
MTDQPTTAGQEDPEASTVARREITAIDGRLPEALRQQFTAQPVTGEPADPGSEGTTAEQ